MAANLSNILIRNGIRYRVFGQVFSLSRYRDEVACYTDNAIAHLLSIPVRWINNTLVWKVGEIEARLWGVSDGERFPRYTVMQLIYLMNCFINRTSTHISGHDIYGR